MIEEGHLVCNHTMKHRDMSHVASQEEFETELRALEQLFYEKTGSVMPKYYRPPEGKFSEENMKFAKAAGYKTIFWSFAYADWDNDRQMSPEKAEQLILNNIHNGAVLLLHPTSATNAAVLGNVIRTLKAQGYRFGTLDELVAP
jgi:peptidoglycan-N-acetylmuramic acid deacetylase